MKKLMGNLNETIWENVKKIDKENFDKIENELEIKFPENDVKYLKNFNRGSSINTIFSVNSEEFSVELSTFEYKNFIRNLEYFHKSTGNYFTHRKIVPVIFQTEFLDEIGEFEGKTLETLRQPLEDGKIVISRANLSVTYPVKNITITASNPTPSGYFPDNPLCNDSLHEIKRYQKKFSGPLLDRMDLYVEMHQLKKDEIFDETLSEKSKDIQARVIKAREIQRQRFKSNTLNKDMNKKQLNKYCKIDEESEEIMKSAIDNLKLSVRMFDKILKVSRTIADLDGEENIKKEHLLEALNYRRK